MMGVVEAFPRPNVDRELRKTTGVGLADEKFILYS